MERGLRCRKLTAGKILGRVGDVRRFRSAAAFASYTGTAPIEVCSGDVVRSVTRTPDAMKGRGLRSS
ncbi:MAG: transposase [Planctomycetaceae bacterium]|nr:transposase [Planctomycetaceae bacterium]